MRIGLRKLHFRTQLMQFPDTGKYAAVRQDLRRKIPVLQNIMPRLIIDMYIVMTELFPTDITVGSERGDDIHESGTQVLCLVRKNDPRMPFRHIIHAGEGTADILEVPVRPAMRLTDVEDEVMHLVYVTVHLSILFHECHKDNGKEPAFKHVRSVFFTVWKAISRYCTIVCRISTIQKRMNRLNLHSVKT